MILRKIDLSRLPEHEESSKSSATVKLWLNVIRRTGAVRVSCIDARNFLLYASKILAVELTASLLFLPFVTGSINGFSFQKSRSSSRPQSLSIISKGDIVFTSWKYLSSDCDVLKHFIALKIGNQNAIRQKKASKKYLECVNDPESGVHSRLRRSFDKTPPLPTS